MKKTFILFCVALFLFFGFKSSVHAGVPLTVYFFYGAGCPHCEKEMKFLESLQEKYPEFEIQHFEVYLHRENSQLLQNIGKSLEVDVSGVPFSVIGEKTFIGFASGITSMEIEKQIQKCLNKNCPDPVADIMQSGIEKESEEKKETKKEIATIPEKLTVPFFGEIEIKNFSLPVLTVVLGALDGFNPCAMWTLMFLISLLLGMKDRKRMFILGSAFIVASASVYFLFMAAWLNLILFIGMIIWVRLAIGIVALAGGAHNLKEYFTNKDSGCKVTGSGKRQKVFEKLKNITHQKSFYLALGGIIILAFAVNLVELICSAGLPAVYTQVLALSNLAKWQYYLYIMLYIFIFMLDDLFIFFVAMTTLQMTGLTTKYSRLSHLIGGVLIIIIGLFLIFKPEWLMFG